MNFFTKPLMAWMTLIASLTVSSAAWSNQFPPANPFPQMPLYYQPAPMYGAMPPPMMNNAVPYSYSSPMMQAPFNRQPMNFSSPTMRFSDMNPFGGNSFSPTDWFNNNKMSNPFKTNSNFYPWNNSGMPFFPNSNSKRGEKNAWGDERHIWPDFYTTFTRDMWDNMINGPYDIGRMPGGWRAPSLSTPDPVTVGDAVTNQFPPIMEEMGNMMHFSD